MPQQRAANIVRPAARKAYDYLVVGAGFAGSVIAERLASQHDARVLVVDRRPHVAGNAYDHLDEAGVLIHQYGPHIFHTNSDEIVDYLSRFTEWRPYEHRVLAEVRGQLVPIPINRTTLNLLFGLDLKTDEEAAAFLASRAEPVDEIRTSEDVVVSAVGRELYENLLPGLYAQAMGHRPERTRQVGDRAHPDPDQHRRPLFQRQHQVMPARRLYGDVRPDARPSQHRRSARRPTIEDVRRRDRRRPSRLHRADRRIFRLPLRQAALPLPALRARDGRPRTSSSRSRWSIIPTRRCPTRGSPSISI